uniref:Cell wall alpha-1,3-glucan synthase mok13 n=1 Tax=Lygus hesperus TaxID=30085 RepID=A0A0A9WRT9_LYGHE
MGASGIRLDKELQRGSEKNDAIFFGEGRMEEVRVPRYFRTSLTSGSKEDNTHLGKKEPRTNPFQTSVSRKSVRKTMGDVCVCVCVVVRHTSISMLVSISCHDIM